MQTIKGCEFAQSYNYEVSCTKTNKISVRRISIDKMDYSDTTITFDVSKDNENNNIVKNVVSDGDIIVKTSFCGYMENILIKNYYYNNDIVIILISKSKWDEICICDFKNRTIKNYVYIVENNFSKIENIECKYSSDNSNINSTIYMGYSNVDISCDICVKSDNETTTYKYSSYYFSNSSIMHTGLGVVALSCKIIPFE